MDRQLKQRIIGVILLLLLAAIIAPLLLRTPEEVRVALDMSLPAPPTVPQMAIEPVVDEREQDMALAEIESDRETIRRAGEEHDLRMRHEQVAEAQPSEPESEPAAPAQPAEPVSAPVRQTEPEAPPLSGWAVQVGSFSNAEAAEAQAVRLRDGGYRAFTRAVPQADKTLHRVFAGPELERADALSLRDRLAADQAFQLQGLVVSLAP